MVVTSGQHYHIAEKHTVIVYAYIKRHASTPVHKLKNCSIIIYSKSDTDNLNQTTPRPSEFVLLWLCRGMVGGCA